MANTWSLNVWRPRHKLELYKMSSRPTYHVVRLCFKANTYTRKQMVRKEYGIFLSPI